MLGIIGKIDGFNIVLGIRLVLLRLSVSDVLNDSSIDRSLLRIDNGSRISSDFVFFESLQAMDRVRHRWRSTRTPDRTDASGWGRSLRSKRWNATVPTGTLDVIGNSVLFLVFYVFPAGIHGWWRVLPSLISISDASCPPQQFGGNRSVRGRHIVAAGALQSGQHAWDDGRAYPGPARHHWWRISQCVQPFLFFLCAFFGLLQIVEDGNKLLIDFDNSTKIPFSILLSHCFVHYSLDDPIVSTWYVYQHLKRIDWGRNSN